MLLTLQQLPNLQCMSKKFYYGLKIRVTWLSQKCMQIYGQYYYFVSMNVNIEYFAVHRLIYVQWMQMFTVDDIQTNAEVAVGETAEAQTAAEGDSSDSMTNIQRKWTKRECVTTVPLFTLNTGAVRELFHDDSATGIFCHLFDDCLIDHIVFQTNLYATQNEKRFEPVCSSELHAFLGLTILFGYHKLPAIRDYWSSDPHLGVPIVHETMKLDRYFGILSNLHANDNKAVPTENKNKLYKLRPVIDMLNWKYQSLRSPCRWQSIDESMVLFKGRSSIKQYNPMKPIKRGYKLWCRSDMNGYIYEFDVYQGKTEGFAQTGLGLGGNVVQKLTQKLHGQNYIVTFDNYFTSPDLLDYLKSKSVLACGTVRSNRKGLPTLATDRSLSRGEFDFRTTEQGLLYVKWKDNKVVHFLSNFHGSEKNCFVPQTERWLSARSQCTGSCGRL